MACTSPSNMPPRAPSRWSSAPTGCTRTSAGWPSPTRRLRSRPRRVRVDLHHAELRGTGPGRAYVQRPGQDRRRPAGGGIAPSPSCTSPRRRWFRSARHRRAAGDRRGAFAGLGWQVPRLLAEMETAGDFYFDTTSQIHMDTWSNGRVRSSATPATRPGRAATAPATRSSPPTSWPGNSPRPTATTGSRSAATSGCSGLHRGRAEAGPRRPGLPRPGDREQDPPA